jgi:L-asparagine transporter-like permease
MGVEPVGSANEFDNPALAREHAGSQKALKLRQGQMIAIGGLRALGELVVHWPSSGSFVTRRFLC